jgi:hypothetical protein
MTLTGAPVPTSKQGQLTLAINRKPRLFQAKASMCRSTLSMCGLDTAELGLIRPCPALIATLAFASSQRLFRNEPFRAAIASGEDLLGLVAGSAPLDDFQHRPGAVPPSNPAQASLNCFIAIPIAADLPD